MGRGFGAARAAAQRLTGAAAGLLLSASWAFADGIPQPGQYTFEEAVTPIAAEMHRFHNYVLLPIISLIVVFVAVLIGIVMVRFNEKANPTPSRTTHHALLEVVWTIAPVIILLIIAVPSFRLLSAQLIVPPSDMTLKVTGKQWYWSYEYPKDQNGGFEFDSTLKQGADLKGNDIRQLAVDNEAVVPVGKVIHVLVTGADVIHSFVVPSFGIRIDAVPGRTNETWFKAEREGIYYGQCSKLCGKDHAFMPIAMRVVSPEAYTAWLNDAKKKYASTNDAPVHLAAAGQ